MNNNALITGASNGIGLAIAKRLSVSFKNIAIHGRDEDRLNKARNHLQKNATCTVTTHRANLDKKNDILKLAHEIKQEYQSLDCLILNAGMYREGKLTEHKTEELQSDFNTNLFSSFELVRELLSLVKLGTLKRIIIIGSTAAYEPYPAVPQYGVQKWALRGFAHNLRKELMKEKIGVSFVSPGGTWTGMWEGEDLPADRLLEPDDIAIMIEASLKMSKQAVLEEIKVVPMLGDLHD